MFHDFEFGSVLAASTRAAWRLEEVLPPDARLDFRCTFMPEALARTGSAPGLSDEERLILNQIRGHEYLSIFGLVEEFILPFVIDHVRPHLNKDDERVRALLNFAGEEAKHIQLFRMFHDRFTSGFGSECGVIGPAADIGAEVLRHDPLAVALLILHVEWMTQRHYLDSVKDDGNLDPLFKSLLRHHWIEEAQHAKLDTLIVEALAEERDPLAIDRAVGSYLEIGAFMDGGFRAQAELNVEALERATGRTIEPEVRDELVRQQHQSLRWTYLGSGMTHPNFDRTLSEIAPQGRARIAEAAPLFS